MRAGEIAHPNPDRLGSASVATLGVILIATILGLAFVAAVGTGTAATGSRDEAMQSQYLAESAAHHALWRFQNEPGFPAAGDVYYMHDLAGGRYGYKMRAPTPTTFATVATVGISGEHVARQSYVPYIQPRDLLLAYGRQNDTVPDFRRLFGTNWSAPADTADIFAEPVHWLELQGSPDRREAIMATLDASGTNRLAVWNGGSWGDQRTFASGVNKDLKTFDVAYESESGDVLVVGRYDFSNTARFNYWNGSSWSFAFSQPAFNHGGWESLTNVVMDSSPVSDAILIGTVCYDYDLVLHYWTGAGFTRLGLFDVDTNTSVEGCLQILHEQQSGDSMVAWTRYRSTSVKYAVLRGASLVQVGQLPAFGDDIRFIRAAADPISDHVFLAAVLNNDELHAAIWNGIAWIDSARIDPQINLHDRQIFDVAWESAGGRAMLAWGPETDKNIPLYVTWTVGDVLADCVPQSAPDCLAEVRLLQLSPVSGGQNLLLVTRNNDKELRSSLWTGAQFHGTEAILLDSAVELDDTMPFDLCEAMKVGVPTPPANSPPLVSAGPDQTTVVTQAASLDGEVADDGLPDPPGSMSTTWSVVSGPGTVAFDDPTQLDTMATFSLGGQYVLRLTADDGELAAFDEVSVAVTVYVEVHRAWSVGSAGAWTPVDLGASPFDVPPDAVLEVAVTNADPDLPRSGGVRAVGSALERRMSLQEAESGGVDALVVHVQADAASRVECFVENPATIQFTLLGYWVRGSYVETWNGFRAGASGAWRNRALAPYGVGAGDVAEVLATNISDLDEWTVGVRTDGSTVFSRAPTLHEAEGGGRDLVSLFVTAGNDLGSTVELWAGSDLNVDFFLAGYWSDPPGAYVEAGVDLGVAAANATWEALDLAGLGVPPAAVVQIGLSNRTDGSENEIGVRQPGSLSQRVLDLHEAEEGGEDLATVHVQTLLDASIERYHEDVSDPHRFYLYGWWE